MIDHVYVSVSDPARSLRFYVAALAPLGWAELFKYDASTGPASVPDLWGMIDGSKDPGRRTSLWLRERRAGETGLYLGLAADSPAVVDAAYRAALQAGGKDDGPPGVRLHFSKGYYAANVLDLDGNRLEFVHKSAAP